MHKIQHTVFVCVCACIYEIIRIMLLRMLVLVHNTLPVSAGTQGGFCAWCVCVCERCMSGGHVRPAANILLVWREGWVGVNFCLVSLSLSLSLSVSLSLSLIHDTPSVQNTTPLLISLPLSLSLSLSSVFTFTCLNRRIAVCFLTRRDFSPRSNSTSNT